MARFDDVTRLMDERFGHDSLISIATVEGGRPYVRTVDAYYEDGAFYVVTYTLSKKMRQIAANPDVAVCGEWFTGHGVGENLGHVLDKANADMMAKLRVVFEAWYDGGHVDEDDPNTCLLRVRLTDGILTDHEKKYGDGHYQVDFVEKSA